MLNFWATLGRAMVDRYFWAGLEENSRNSNKLAEVQELRNFLVYDLGFQLTRYEIMEINRIVQLDVDSNYHYKFLDTIRDHFRIDSIQFPRDLKFCAVLGHALVDENFAQDLHYHRNDPDQLRNLIAQATNIDLEYGDAETIGRFFKTDVTRPPSSGAVAVTYRMYEILKVANQALWVKPDEDSPFADLLGTGPGQCGESPANSDNYIHLNGPAAREALFLARSRAEQRCFLQLFGITSAETEEPGPESMQLDGQPEGG